jgi:hypothetical protein
MPKREGAHHCVIFTGAAKNYGHVSRDYFRELPSGLANPSQLRRFLEPASIPTPGITLHFCAANNDAFNLTAVTGDRQLVPPSQVSVPSVRFSSKSTCTPAGRASGAGFPGETPGNISGGYLAGFTQRSSPIKIFVRSEPGFALSSIEPA